MSQPPARSAAGTGARRVLLVLLAATLAAPAAPVTNASVVRSPAPSPAVPAAPLSVRLAQVARAYDAVTNIETVRVTATPADARVPWDYVFAVRGQAVKSGTTSSASVTVRLRNDCSITTQSVTVAVSDAAGNTGDAAAILDYSLCPPPPDLNYRNDPILAGPTLTRTSFIDRLRAVGSPALAEAGPIWRALRDGGVNPAFALGLFHAESHSGTRGYAVTTLNWGNILYYPWVEAFGGMPYSPGNGYTYTAFPSWLAGVEALVDLLQRYQARGWTTIKAATARWLGTTVGSARHLRYLRNVTATMKILPRDAVPVLTSLSVPTSSRAAVKVAWTATDDKLVTRHLIRVRNGSGSWSEPSYPTGSGTTLQLSSGTWTVRVRAGDADGNWSLLQSGTVAVDADAPAMTHLAAPPLVRSPNATFTARWAASDNVGVARYQYRFRRTNRTTWSDVRSTTDTSRTFQRRPGSWLLAVRAIDAVGNGSPWREVRVVVPVDDRKVAFSSGTVRRTSSRDYRGTFTTTRRDNARLTTSFTGTHFYLLGRAGPSYGRLRVTIDGRSWVVDTGLYRGARATSVHRRVVLFRMSVEAGRHVVTITNLATRGRPTIAIDGLGFARA